MAEEKKEAAPPKKEEGKKTESAKNDKPNYVLIAIVILAIVLIQIIATFFVIKALKPQDPADIAEKMKQKKIEEERKKLTGMGKTLEEPISVLVNLSGEDSDKFLKTELILEYDESKAETVLPQITERMPKLKDISIGFLSSLEFDEIKDRKGKRRVLLRLKNELNKIFPEPETITNVYFGAFVVQ